MDFTTVIFLLIFAVIIKLIIDSINKSNTSKALPYERNEKLFTPNEHKFYLELKQVLGNKYQVHGKVRMEDIIKVKKGLERKEAYGYRSRIKSRHIDFTICDIESSKIMVAIELDDSTHNRGNSKKIDQFKNDAFKAAGVPLIRFKIAKSYREKIIEELKKAGKKKH